jgi:hypothetical protein
MRLPRRSTIGLRRRSGHPSVSSDLKHSLANNGGICLRLGYDLTYRQSAAFAAASFAECRSAGILVRTLKPTVVCPTEAVP